MRIHDLHSIDVRNYYFGSPLSWWFVFWRSAVGIGGELLAGGGHSDDIIYEKAFWNPHRAVASQSIVLISRMAAKKSSIVPTPPSCIIALDLSI